MPRSTIAVVDTKRLSTIFGPRDSHLRRIREALGVGIAARGDAIHIDGEEHAVLRATEVFEELDRLAREQGGVERDEVDRLLRIATGEEFAAHRPQPIEVHRPGGQLVPKSSGQAAYVQAIREHRSSAVAMAVASAPINSTPWAASTPDSDSAMARLSAVCPPSVGRSASGFSRSMMRSSTPTSSGST